MVYESELTFTLDYKDQHLRVDMSGRPRVDYLSRTRYLRARTSSLLFFAVKILKSNTKLPVNKSLNSETLKSI
jgi:hypothetical protein